MSGPAILALALSSLGTMSISEPRLLRMRYRQRLAPYIVVGPLRTSH